MAVDLGRNTVLSQLQTPMSFSDRNCTVPLFRHIPSKWSSNSSAVNLHPIFIYKWSCTNLQQWGILTKSLLTLGISHFLKYKNKILIPATPNCAGHVSLTFTNSAAICQYLYRKLPNTQIIYFTLIVHLYLWMLCTEKKLKNHFFIA